MALSKRVVCVMGVFALAMCMLACFVGCGKQSAATWSGGDLTEEEVTTAVNNLRSYYQIQDDETWASFVKQRAYDTSDQETDLSSTSAVGYAKEQDPSKTYTDSDLGANVDLGDTTAKSEEPKDETGTTEEMREYVIGQIIRQRIIEKEIESRHLSVTDQEVDDAIDQLRAYVEAQYMEGVFESFLQMQGYKDLNAYKKEVREQLIQVKLQKEIAGTTDENGNESIDQAKWKEWLDGKYAEANVKINAPAKELSYAIVETSSESSSASTSSSAE